jgi:uncharacterized protein YjdB
MISVAQSDGLPRGAYDVPYKRYESENATRGGGAVLYTSPQYVMSQIASEASDQKYVGLPSNGSSISWTMTNSGAGFNMRFTLPDLGSTGQTGSLNLYVNNTLVKTINLTSYWAWQYFNMFEHDPSNVGPKALTFMRFDEVHFRLATKLNAGDVVRIQKDAGSLEIGVDFIEVEEVPSAIGKPAGYISVVEHGAIANDGVDDQAAFNAAISAANAAHTGIYIPEGQFTLAATWRVTAQNIGIKGAGMWYTNVHYSTNAFFSGGLMSNSTGLDISDIYFSTNNNIRWENGQYRVYKGMMGTYGTGTKMQRLWIEHFECGMWIGDYDNTPLGHTSNLLISHCRIRNNYADGINLCQGTNNSIIEFCSVRNNGDDGLASWSAKDMGNIVECTNLEFRNNTIENNWRAGSIGIFGGSNHKIHHNYIKDGVAGSGIRFTTEFPGYRFENNTNMQIYENTMISCGTSTDLVNQEKGAIELYDAQGPIKNMFFTNNTIINAQRHGVILGAGTIDNIKFDNLTIDGTGLDNETKSAFAAPSGGYAIFSFSSSGTATFTNLVTSRLEEPALYYKGQQGYNIIINTGPPVAVTGVSVNPTTASVVQGQTTQLTATIAPANATNKNVTWTSSNAAIASVNSSGVVTGASPGSATITATTADGNKTASSSITVTAAPGAVNIAATDASAGEGGNPGVFTISTGSLSSNITVGYTISGTATSGDYTATPALSGSVTLTSAAPSATITINPVDDTAFEGSESLTLTIQSGTGYTVGSNSSATISIADNDNPPCTSPVIGFTSTAPTIDQSIDAAWSSVPAGSLSKVTLGAMPSDFAGSQWRAMYDATNLYILVEVKDNNRFNDSGTSWWEDDVVEIFIDGNNSKGSSYDGVDDFQLGFRYNDTGIKIGGTSVTRTTGIVFAQHNVTNGYNIEVRIPWSTIGTTASAGKLLGFEIEVDDDDNGGTRDSQVSAFATASTAWSNPGLFGSVYLTTCNVQPIAVTGVTISPATTSICIGSTQQLTPTVSPANATNKNVSYTSSNTAIATVNSSGLVTGIAAGTVNVTVTTQDGAKTATSAVTISACNVPVTGVTVSPTTQSLNIGGTIQLTATIAPSNATNKSVTWSTSNASAATVNSTGLVTSVGAGSANITVTTVDQSKTAVSVITVNSNSQTAYPGGTPWAIPGTIEVENYDNGGEGIAYHDNEAANQGGQYRTTEGVDVEVCSEGGFNVGWTGTGEWLEYTVNVTAGSYNVDVRTASTLAGGTFHIEFNGVDKTGLFTTTNTGAWQTWTTISKTGISLAGGVQVMRIFLDNANFNLNKVTFSPANTIPTGVTVSPTSASIGVGSSQQLVATVSPSNASQAVAWSSSNTSIATVNSAGLVTGVALGTATITATTQDGSKTATSTITVANAVGTVACNKTSLTMTINGSLSETSWSVVNNAFNKTTVGTPNNTATFGVLWDANNLYIGAKVIDANLNSDSADPWEDDAIEIYIDANNNKLTSYDGKDNQIIKNYNKSTVFTKFAITGLQHGWAAISGGYSIEIAVPWSQLGITAPAAGTTLGFDIGYDDDDNAGARDGQAVWRGTTDNYQNTSAFGSIVLSNTTARAAVEETIIADESITFWPTIVESELHIQSDGTFKSVDVIDMLGRVHHHDDTIEGKESLTMDLSHLTGGLHFVKMRNEVKSKVFRIVKK